MKTFNKKDVFYIANAEDAKKYIGYECYFGDSFNGLQYCIDNNIKGLLKCVRDDDDNTVGCIFVADCDIEVMDGRYITSFGLCLPCELVKMEKNFRPFKSVEEFKSVVGDIGNVICFKQMHCNTKYDMMLIGFLENYDSCKTHVLIGNHTIDFDGLFAYYVLVKDGKEVPFGIKVDHEES